MTYSTDPRWRPSAVCRWIIILVAAVAGVTAGRAADPAFVWLEGESAETSFTVGVSGWGRPHFLSESKWLHLSVEKGKVDEEVPDLGILLTYPFVIEEPGLHEIWNRIGFEFVRSPFVWRIDDRPWQTASPEGLTTDLMELAVWCEVAWLKMGNAHLASGSHQLQIRLEKTRNDQGQWQRILYASDALCLYPGTFRPNGRFKPSDSGRLAADEEAARVVFALPEAGPGERAAVALKGVWEIARHDEQSPGEVAEPIRDLPTHPVWRAIPVPGDKNKLREDLIFAHRLWYRTRVEVPRSLAGRAFFLKFPYNNLNTTVYVNGVYCGFEKNPFVNFQIDVTAGIKAGQVNEIWVGIRDAWYGRSADPERPLKLRKTFNLPLDFFRQGFQDMDYPLWNCPQSGILATPTLVAAGSPVYVADVFVKPSVANRRLETDVTVTNTRAADLSGEIRWEAVDDATGRVAHVFPSFAFTLGGRGSESFALRGDWANPQLWWPDAPALYRLRTTLVVQGTPVDVRETRFGFREWRVEGTQFTLNGVVWHMWADLIGDKASPEAWLQAYRETHQRTMRLSTAGQAGQSSRWFGMEPNEALEFFDRNGVVVRRNTTLDGETIGYHFSESDPVTREKQGGSELKLALLRNWRDQCVAQIRGERNHPCIQIWTIENEFAFINLVNLLGNSPNMDRYEEEITRTHDAVLAVDPTRSVMVDGGGALKDNTLGVAGDHYVATLDARYPDLAYEPFVEGGGRGRWRWDQQRPRFIGEDFYATGINPADYARWGGEVAFQGKAAARGAIARCYRMLNEGYRWGGHYAAWHFWVGNEGGAAQWVANAPRAALVREWDWTFGAGQQVQRTFGIFNDTRENTPITFIRRLSFGGREVYAQTTTHEVAPGTAEKFVEVLPMPAGATRQEGTLSLVLTVDGREVFRDTKSVSVLPPPTVEAFEADKVLVFDPAGGTADVLREAGVRFTPARSLDDLPEACKVLVVGRDAIEADVSTSTRLSVIASEGRAVVVMDQSFPLKYQAIPAALEPAPRSKKNGFGTEVPTADGSTAFIEDASHRALSGLLDKDFFTWGPGLRVYRNAYLKPTRGAKSLVQCGPRLEYSALVEVPVGEGVLYLSQLDFGEEGEPNAVARRLLINLVHTGAAYQLEYANVASVIRDEHLNQAAEAIGLQHAGSDDILAALRADDQRILLASATPADLKRLADNPGILDAFWQRGGYLVLCGLTPEGLVDFNRLVGVPHGMRPFNRERVTFPPVRNPLTAGLTTGDIVMLSGERIFGWTADEFVVSDAFRFVVDLDDVAPFAESDFGNYDNIVNGFVGSDGWPLIIDFEHPRDGSPYRIELGLPREESLVEFTYDQSINYNPTTKIALVFDGEDRLEWAVPPNGEPLTVSIDPPRQAREVTLEILEWQSDPAKRPIIGIDNISLKVRRSEAWRAVVKPMLNIGGLVQYAKANGGVVLCNLNFQANETVPANQAKKRTILATLLRNLKAPFSGGRSVIAGANLVCRPLDIHTKATTYKDERGWFGDRRRTLKGLPAGSHVLGGIPYNLYEMPTSPVPQVLMLGGANIPGNLPDEILGIPVHTKADALFFLHTARLDRRMNERERAEKKRYELCRYVVHYVDGSTQEVPVIAEVDIDHFLQRNPQPLPGAQLAWTGTDEDVEEIASVYAQQWNNPRPDVDIQSVDLVPGSNKERGVPALLAITAATAPRSRSSGVSP